jgi:hypothetical protein
VWCVKSPNPTIGVLFPLSGGCELCRKSLPNAYASQTTSQFAPAKSSDLYKARPRDQKFLWGPVSTPNGWQRWQAVMKPSAVSETISTTYGLYPYQSEVETFFQTVLESSNTCFKMGSRSPFLRGRPSCFSFRGGAAPYKGASRQKRVIMQIVFGNWIMRHRNSMAAKLASARTTNCLPGNPR